MTPFDAYKTYLSIKMHFTSPTYDAIKYHGKVNANIQTFEKRRDKYQFAKLSKLDDIQGFLISNFVSDTFTGWVGDLFTDESEKVYYDWKARQQSLTYNFKLDLEKLEDDFLAHFKVKKGQFPSLLVMVNRGTIALETFVILNDVLNFFSVWDEKINDTVIWPRLRDKCLKYRPFIQYDKAKIKSLIRPLIPKTDDK